MFWDYFFRGKQRTHKLSLLGKRLSVALLSLCLFWVMGFQAVWADEIAPSDSSIQPYLKRVKREITEFTLDNGMRFIVLERHRSPVISFLIYADVGGANEPDGQTGVAHYLEHLAFKGTQHIGTTNYQEHTNL